MATRKLVGTITTMTTDEEKTKIAKLLNGLEVPEVRLTERCNDLVKDFQQKFSTEVDEEIGEMEKQEVLVNPYKVDKQLLNEIEKKLEELLSRNKNKQKERLECVVETCTSTSDPQRPWRTNTNKEKLMRIDNKLKRNLEKCSEMITPLQENQMQELIQSCREECGDIPMLPSDRLRETVEEARKNLPNFQYKRLKNTTATEILPNAHDLPC